jgi:hypothetical protein
LCKPSLNGDRPATQVRFTRIGIHTGIPILHVDSHHFETVYDKIVSVISSYQINKRELSFVWNTYGTNQCLAFLWSGGSSKVIAEFQLYNVGVPDYAELIGDDDGNTDS